MGSGGKPIRGKTKCFRGREAVGSADTSRARSAGCVLRRLWLHFAADPLWTEGCEHRPLLLRRPELSELADGQGVGGPCPLPPERNYCLRVGDEDAPQRVER